MGVKRFCPCDHASYHGGRQVSCGILAPFINTHTHDGYTHSTFIHKYHTYILTRVSTYMPDIYYIIFLYQIYIINLQREKYIAFSSVGVSVTI